MEGESKSNTSEHVYQNEDDFAKTTLSTSFTISFDDDEGSAFKQKKIKTNMFVRRHIRTLSLPVPNSAEPEIKCKTVNSPVDSKPSKLINELPNESHFKCNLTEVEPAHVDESIGDSAGSESLSEGGTYTLDKDNEELKTARKSIDKVFGINSGSLTQGKNIIENISSKCNVVDAWVEKCFSPQPNIRRSSTSSIVAETLKKKSLISRIPSPVLPRREINNKKNAFSMYSKNNGKINMSNGDASSTVKSKIVNTTPINGDIDTESYLKETESIVTALHNRLLNNVVEKHGVEKESPISNTRFNRAFSLRRGRLKSPIRTLINKTAIPIRFNDSDKIASSHRSTTQIARPTSLKISSSDLQIKQAKSLRPASSSGKKTTKSISNASGTRSVSSLSSQEKEFQNWKRRKNYDPLKAAAEDRKKKSTISVAATTKNLQKARNSSEEEKQNGNAIHRSASFHGLKTRNGYDKFHVQGEEINNNFRRSSGMNNFDSTLCNSIVSRNSSSLVLINNDDDEDDYWSMPKPPSSSLQNTPPESLSSKLSVLSNTISNSSVLLSTPSFVRVDYMSLMNVAHLTSEIHTIMTSIMQKLKNCGETSSSLSGNEVWRIHHGNSCDNQAENEDTFCDNDGEGEIQFSDDNSELNDLSGSYQLNKTFDNLQKIKETAQSLLVTLGKENRNAFS